MHPRRLLSDSIRKRDRPGELSDTSTGPLAAPRDAHSPRRASFVCGHLHNCFSKVGFNWVMDHLCTTRSRSGPSATVRERVLIRCSRSSLFAIVRLGHLCKQGVVGSSPIVSTTCDLA